MQYCVLLLIISVNNKEWRIRWLSILNKKSICDHQNVPASLEITFSSFWLIFNWRISSKIEDSPLISSL